MRIFFLYFEARPSPGSESFSTIGGAFVSCWVQAEDQKAAAHIANQDIDEQGFEAISLLETRCVARSDYENEPEWLTYVERAEEEGECYLYNAWPAEPQEGDTIH